MLGRRSPLLKLAGDERLVALIRAGHEHAFEALFERYHSRLLAFCRHMLRLDRGRRGRAPGGLREGARGDARRRPPDQRAPVAVPDRAQPLPQPPAPPVPRARTRWTSWPGEERRHHRRAGAEARGLPGLVADVRDLPETQRTALLLREIDALTYEEIAPTMDTTVPAVKSLLVRARMSLAEATQSRQLTCGEVRLELAEAAEGLCKASGPVRHHVKRCDPCREFRGELRSNPRRSPRSPSGRWRCCFKLIVRQARWAARRGLGRGSGGRRRNGSPAGAAPAGPPPRGRRRPSPGGAAAARSVEAVLAGGAAAARRRVGGAIGAKAAADRGHRGAADRRRGRGPPDLLRRPPAGDSDRRGRALRPRPARRRAAPPAPRHLETAPGRHRQPRLGLGERQAPPPPPDRRGAAAADRTAAPDRRRPDRIADRLEAGSSGRPPTAPAPAAGPVVAAPARRRADRRARPRLRRPRRRRPPPPRDPGRADPAARPAPTDPPADPPAAPPADPAP